MIEVTYFKYRQARKKTHFLEDYNEFVRAQQACWIALPDATPVTKVTINGHDIGYKGQYVWPFNFFYYVKFRLWHVSVIIGEQNQTSCSGSFFNQGNFL